MTESSHNPPVRVQDAPPRSPKPELPHVPSVSQCGLTLTAIDLRFLILTPGEGSCDSLAASLKCEGTLKTDSIGPTGFRALVAWGLAFPEGVRPPISVSGKHELVFNTNGPLSSDAALYYAKVNSAILAFPYIRQLIDFLSVSALGRNVMVPPLDVPRFVEEAREAWLKQVRPEEGSPGDTADGTEAH